LIRDIHDVALAFLGGGVGAVDGTFLAYTECTDNRSKLKNEVAVISLEVSWIR
jgi:hypothetical protein